MTWFFKATFDNAHGEPTGENWYGPYTSEDEAIAARDALVSWSAKEGRDDSYTTPSTEDGRPSRAIMIVADADGVDWVGYEDGTRTLKPV